LHSLVAFWCDWGREIGEGVEGLYRCSGLARGLGIRWNRTDEGDAMFGPVSCSRWKTTDSWGPPISGCAAGQHTNSVQELAGWASFGLWAKTTPPAFSHFLYSFSIFWILICFKLCNFIQINSNKFLNFLKFTAIF
jgi:hypothetical protein